MAPDFQCSHCGIVYANMRNLKRHLTSLNTDSFTCPHCMLTTKRKDNLKRHSDKYHAASNSSVHSQMPALAVNPICHPESKSCDEPVPIVLAQTQVRHSDHGEFDNRLHLPHNFIFAGATQSVSLLCMQILLFNLCNICFRAKLLC